MFPRAYYSGILNTLAYALVLLLQCVTRSNTRSPSINHGYLDSITSYSLLYKAATDHNDSVLFKILDRYISDFPPGFIPIGHTTLLPFHFDRDCVSFSSTNILLYSGCTLPPHCGPPSVSKVSSTWYGSEILMCVGAYSCPHGSSCRHDLLLNTYYYIVPDTRKYESKNYYGLNLRPLINSHVSTYLVDNEYTNTSTVYSRFCVDNTYRTPLRHMKIADPIHYKISHGDAKSCVEALRPEYHNKSCMALSSYTSYNKTSRFVKSSLMAEPINILYSDDLKKFSYLHEYIFPFPEKVNTAFDYRPILFIEFPEYCLPKFSVTNSIWFTSPCPVGYNANAIYSDTVCYPIVSHYTNPFSSAFNWLYSKLISFFHYIESEFETILEWVFSLITKLLSHLLSLFVSIPNFFPVLYTYLTSYYFSLSHVVSISITVALWLLFSI